MWSLLGAKLRLHNAAGFSCAPSAALLALVILLSFLPHKAARLRDL